MKDIDLETWPRKNAYHLFRQSQQPHFSVTVPIDVTGLMTTLKPDGVPILNYTLFAIMQAVNEIPEFRLRFEGDRVFELDQTDPSFTVPIEGNNFAFCQVTHSGDWNEFNARCTAAVEAAKQQAKLVEEADHFRWTYLTCGPWLNFTSMTHPVDGPDDCIPRIAWGKITENNGAYSMPLNIQMHHALADGYHAAQFFASVEQLLK